MKELFLLLRRFSRSLDKDQNLKETVISLIGAATNITLSTNDVSLKGGVLTIIASAAAKNEIKLKESKIISLFKENKIPVLRILYT